MSNISTEVRVEELIADVQEKRKQSLATKINRWPRKNPILSDISDCDRQMVYSVLNWEERPLHNEELQARFEEGKKQERNVLVELQELGYDVILSQQPVTVHGRNRNILATGKIDGFIVYRGRRFPLEIKSMNPNIYNQIDTIDDFMKKAWLRKYVRQLMMYLFGNNEEQGLFLVTDCMGHWKLIAIFLDYGECELILQRLEKDYTHIQAKTYPDRIPYSREMCGKCSFSRVCLPDILNLGIPLIDDEHMESVLKERASLEQSADRYEELDKEAKEAAKAVGKDFILGTSWKVEIRKTGGKRINAALIPIEERSKYEVDSERTVVEFVPLKELH